MTNKRKIQTTNRIRMNYLNGMTTMYVSSEIVRDVREFLVRLENNVMVPARGKQPELFNRLLDLAAEKPDHFTKSGGAILRDYQMERDYGEDPMGYHMGRNV